MSEGSIIYYIDGSNNEPIPYIIVKDNGFQNEPEYNHIVFVVNNKHGGWFPKSHLLIRKHDIINNQFNTFELDLYSNYKL
jgi:hypothetical protein